MPNAIKFNPHSNFLSATAVNPIIALNQSRHTKHCLFHSLSTLASQEIVNISNTTQLQQPVRCIANHLPSLSLPCMDRRGRPKWGRIADRHKFSQPLEHNSCDPAILRQQWDPPKGSVYICLPQARYHTSPLTSTPRQRLP